MTETKRIKLEQARIAADVRSLFPAGSRVRMNSKGRAHPVLKVLDFKGEVVGYDTGGWASGWGDEGFACLSRVRVKWLDMYGSVPIHYSYLEIIP